MPVLFGSGYIYIHLGEFGLFLPAWVYRKKVPGSESRRFILVWIRCCLDADMHHYLKIIHNKFKTSFAVMRDHVSRSLIPRYLGGKASYPGCSLSGALSSDQLGRLAAGALSEESLDELVQEDQGSGSQEAPELGVPFLDLPLVLPGSETPSESASEDAPAASDVAPEASTVPADMPEPEACVSSTD